jgi:dTDP-4-dehydrorhamnose 3,5-epimerase
MTITPAPLPGILIFQPRVFADARGYFLESYRKQLFKDAGISSGFVQDNESMSGKNVLRGLHFQCPPWEQGKLVRVIRGAVLDVAVDLRKDSPAYGKHFSLELSEKLKNMLWIPPGFAHGFATLEENTIFSYKCTGYYNKESESGIRWNDPDLKIDWKISNPLVSEKDSVLPFFKELKSPF